MAHALLILGMAAVTFLTRALPIAILSRRTLPEGLSGWLRHIPVAVFTVIAVQGTLAPTGQLYFSLGSPYIWGGIAAVVVAWRTGNVFLTILAGLAGLWLGRGCL